MSVSIDTIFYKLHIAPVWNLIFLKDFLHIYLIKYLLCHYNDLRSFSIFFLFIFWRILYFGNFNCLFKWLIVKIIIVNSSYK